MPHNYAQSHKDRYFSWSVTVAQNGGELYIYILTLMHSFVGLFLFVLLFSFVIVTHTTEWFHGVLLMRWVRFRFKQNSAVFVLLWCMGVFFNVDCWQRLKLREERRASCQSCYYDWSWSENCIFSYWVCSMYEYDLCANVAIFGC